MVSRTRIQVFSAEYRLPPEFTLSTTLEDCYSALVWLQKHAQQYKIDPSRLAVQGESAGGGLAAALALLAQDRRLSPPIAKQILIYPMLDDRNLKANEFLEPFAIWSIVDNITAWTAYLGSKPGVGQVS